ncbi:hypothetical protein [Terrimonas pollutisoli]|uniref:hypothetical protein n=1 Tax=Terrimonas pollutisoli TaxID=3034147 RepID=UPI0023EC1111|nr:hypothetical protein [Terrimonas sp. H1YJ31]
MRKNYLPRAVLTLLCHVAVDQIVIYQEEASHTIKAALQIFDNFSPIKYDFMQK